MRTETTSEPIDYIELTRNLYDSLGYPPYRWVVNEDPPPFSPVTKPVRESRIGLIASGGIYVAGQVAFHHRDDSSFRLVDTATDASALRTSHFAYDMTDARRDPNVVFPVGTLRDLAARGEIGELSPRAYTFMGGIYSVRKVRDHLAPELVRRVQSDEVDLVLLVPV